MPVKIVFLDRNTIGPGVHLRKPAFEHQWLAFPKTSPGQVIARLQGAQIAIVNKVPIDVVALEALPELKFIAIAATGTDIVDLQACREKGVKVANIRGYATTSVPEHTLALIMALRRNLVQYREQVIAGEWQKADQFCFFNRPVYDLSGATIGLIGTGAIASAVGALCEALGMRVLYHSVSGRAGVTEKTVPGKTVRGKTVPGKNLVGLQELLRTADVVSCHCPLTEQSYHLLGKAAFQIMKPSALLVNTARGQIVDTAALLEAIDAGQLAGAGIDVAEVEPPPSDSALMALARRDNVIVTPHVAWASIQSMQILADQLIDNIEAYHSGKPVNLV